MRADTAVRAAIALVLVLALVSPGDGSQPEPVAHPKRVACLGDSNTFALPPMTAKGWCELLDAQLAGTGWTARSFASIGAMVSGERTTTFATAADHIAAAEADWHPDVYVMAYGTNDLKLHSPEQVLAAYERWRTDLGAKRRRVLVATTPPRFPPAKPDPKGAELNALLRQRIPARDLVDFDSILATTDFDIDGTRLHNRDGIHINLAGQAKRARAVRTALLP